MIFSDSIVEDNATGVDEDSTDDDNENGFDDSSKLYGTIGARTSEGLKVWVDLFISYKITSWW